MVDTARGTSRARVPERVQLLFVALIASWLLLPFLQVGVLAEDAIPFITSVRVQAADASALYGTAEREVPQPVRDAGCPLTPPGTNCDTHVFPFLGPPQIMPVMKVVNLFGDTGSVLVMRLLSAASFSGALWVLWRSVTRRRADAAVPLLLTAVLLTPFVYTSVAFGQNTPLMLLSACLGMSQTDRTARAAGTAAVWVITFLFKLFPLPLLLLAVLRRRWKFLAFSALFLAVATVAAVPLAPPGAYEAFFATSRGITADRVASPWNVSLDAFVHQLDASWRGAGAAFYAFVALRVAIVGSLAWWKLRDADEDLQWAYAWLALLALHPQIWWHYFVLIIPPIALSLRDRTGGIWYLVPGAAVLLLPMAMVTDETFLRFYGPLLIALSVLAIPFIPRRPRVAPRPVEVSVA
jgi:hypothetical protein